MNNKWYIGQPIVAIEKSPNFEIKKGKEYEIKGINFCGCGCRTLILDVGIEYNANGNKYVCSASGKHYYGNYKGFSETRFAPLDQDISELTDILKEPIKEFIEN
jgi:hypothetical protein